MPRASAFDADVIVAGGGPAGAVAARTLASAGLDTLVVDRAEFPRNKACGGGISTRAFTRFPWLRSVLSGVDLHYVSKLHLEGPASSVMTLQAERPCVVLARRVELDHALIRAAADAGARLEARFEITRADIEPGRVTVRARDGRVRSAPVAIAADGVHSVMAKRLGANPRWPRTKLALDMMEETPHTTLRATQPDVLWVAYAHAGLDGYAYVFPKAHHVNVGIGCLLSHFDEHVTAPPYALQRAFVDRLTDSGVLEGTSDRACFTPFLIPVGGPLDTPSIGPVLFAGDAGGFVNAITAEGIYYAMVSGELAGRAIAASRRAPARAGSRYDRLWRRELGAELRDATLLQRYLFSDHHRVARVVRGAAGLPWFTDLILAYTRGERSYSAVRRAVVLRFPATAWRLVRERWGRGVG
jgi:geranylgeranyl reductase family protein